MIFRKFAISAAIVFIRDDLLVQSLAVAMILNVALVAHVYVLPMSGTEGSNSKGKIENTMESVSLTVTYLTV